MIWNVMDKEEFLKNTLLKRYSKLWLFAAADFALRWRNLWALQPKQESLSISNFVMKNKSQI